MKNKFKRVFSAWLAVITVFSATAVFGTSTYAAESEATPVVSGDVVADTVEQSTEPTEPVTRPSTSVTEPVTVPTTVPATEPTTKPAPKVGNVKNIEKTSFLTDSITLKWDKVSGASGYYIYYKNADSSNTFKKISEVTSNTCTIKNFK